MAGERASCNTDVFTVLSGIPGFKVGIADGSDVTSAVRRGGGGFVDPTFPISSSIVPGALPVACGALWPL